MIDRNKYLVSQIMDLLKNNKFSKEEKILIKLLLKKLNLNMNN